MKTERCHIEDLNLHPTPATALNVSDNASPHDLDPNHPQSWNAWTRYLAYLTVCVLSFLATMNTSKFTVAIVPIASEFNKDAGSVDSLVSYSVLALGFGNVVWVVLLRVIGRRPTFLLSLLILTVCNIWSATANSYASLMASTVIGALASACGEAPVSAFAADLFRAENRGAALMVFHLGLSAGFFVGPAINAALVQNAGWRWVCGWIAIASGVTLLVGLATIRETAHYPGRRRLPYPRDLLDFKAGFNPGTNIWSVTKSCIAVAAYPAVLWTGLTAGVFVGWNIIVQLTTTHTTLLPPYTFSLSNIGTLTLSGFIGALPALFLGGTLLDSLSNTLTTRSSSPQTRKPEYRLPGLLLPSVIGPMGILTFGLCAAHKTHWIGLAFGIGMQGFGLTAASNVLVTYLVDSYPDRAGETTVILFLIRGVSGCLLSVYAYDWVEAVGPAEAFGDMVGIQYFCVLLAVVFWVFGGRIRAWSLRGTGSVPV
ncbi:MFS general substrate transporter [Aspergillus californicus]